MASDLPVEIFMSANGHTSDKDQLTKFEVQAATDSTPAAQDVRLQLRPKDLHRPSLAGLVAFAAIYFNCFRFHTTPLLEVVYLERERL